MLDVSHLNVFSETSPQERETKEVNKWDSNQTERFYTTKETINKMKRQPPAWENIFTNNASDKGLISEIYKELIQHQKINNPRIKWGKDLNRPSAKGHTDGNRHMKRCSMSLIIREMQIKPQYYILPHTCQNGSHQ
ncbi:hypothetical protein HJG60_012269 [Phyllostomus discolor]|uniref:Uncharacterized protein n=1 Tax=Phyllostomus discolor TaxID=89673 RepID=A0A833ZBG6_9CHIR|nr:hypothetical protein HJG60_012269 [Phyllostomus discolor]